MYSLLCRHARISVFNQVSEGEDALTGVSKPAEQQVAGSNRGRWLERSKALQKALLGIVLLGTAFMFCDGVLSPSASGAWLAFGLTYARQSRVLEKINLSSKCG